MCFQFDISIFLKDETFGKANDECMMKNSLDLECCFDEKKHLAKASIWSESTVHLRSPVRSLIELWMAPGDRGHARCLLSGLSISDSPLLSDACCRHRSMHHALVKPPLPLSSTHPESLQASDTVPPPATHTHTHTHHFHYGDKSCLIWYPSVSHGASMLCESKSPIICLDRKSVV